jgi:hypothetical protein
VAGRGCCRRSPTDCHWLASPETATFSALLGSMDSSRRHRAAPTGVLLPGRRGSSPVVFHSKASRTQVHVGLLGTDCMQPVHQATNHHQQQQHPMDT